jgi:PPE-repeat protein
LTAFAAPPQTTNPGGVGNQAAAVTQATGTGGLAQTVSAVPQTLQHLASAGSSGPINQINQLLLNITNSGPVQGASASEGVISTYIGNPEVDFSLVNVVAGFVAGIPTDAGTAAGLAAADHIAAAAAAAPASLAGSYGSGVSAGLGQAASVGGLSVPQSWATASPAIRLAATALPAGGLGSWAGSAAPGGMFTGAPGGMFNGMRPMGYVVNAPRNGEARSQADSRRKVIPQMSGELGVDENTPGRWVNPDRDAPHDASALSERDELNDLRMAIAKLTKERDVLERSAILLIKETMQL